MKKLVILAILLLAFGSLGLHAQDTLEIAFIFTGPIADSGWSTMHNEGRLAIEEAFGDAVETEVVEGVDPENTALVLNELINSGYRIIFTSSLDHQEGVLEVAAEHPEVQFINVAGTQGADNVAVVHGRIYQSRYLSGIVAGSMTEANVIGYVAAFPFPSLIRDINAFTLGVKSVNPDAVVQVVFTETWYDPVIEASSADSLVLAGADILAQHQNSPAVQEAAARIGVFSISYNSDMSAIADTVLTGPMWNWGVKYVEIVQQILDGTYAGNENYWGGMGDGLVTLAPFSPLVPEDVIALVEQERARIESGEWDVFCGPIYGEVDGEPVTIVEEGFCMTDAEILSMNFFIEGVIGAPAPAVAPAGIGQAKN